MSVSSALQRFSDRRDEYLDDLKHLVRIPSVSFPGHPPEKVDASAQAVAELLTRVGLQSVEVLRIDGAHPYVYGEWCRRPGAPTLLLYAHHDVQPIGREHVWKTPPFEPTLGDDGRLYGRGAADDKAGIVVHTSAIDCFLKSEARDLPLNVKVLIEGEEEIGSAHLSQFLQRFHEKLQADVIVLTDTANFDTGVPSITTSLRGLAAVEVEVQAQSKPLHSGAWGGPVVDPVQALARMIAALTDEAGRIVVPGVMDDVLPLTDEEARALEGLPCTEAEFRAQAGMPEGLQLMGGNSPLFARIWREPALSVNAIQASSRAGAGNIICDTAWAKIGIRTVPNQVGEKVVDALSNHLRAVAPWGVNVQIHTEACGNWWRTETVHPAFRAAERALEKGFDRPPVTIGCGGSIPFVEPFARELGGVPALLLGIEDPYTDAHAENESLHLGDWERAVKSAIHLYQELATLDVD